MSGTIPKFELMLNEESEINFKLSIEGSSSDSEMTTPKFRFVLTEAGSPDGHGWLFPAKNEGNDIVSVKIPPLKEGIHAGKKYHGKLEVLMGSLLVVPTEVVVEFARPLQIEATPILSKKQQGGDGQAILRAEAVTPAKKHQEKDAVVVKNTQAGMAMDHSLMEVNNEKEEVEMAESIIKPPPPAPRKLPEVKKPSAPPQPTIPTSRQPQAAPVMKKKQTLEEVQKLEKEAFMNRLKEMFKSALKDGEF